MWTKEKILNRGWTEESFTCFAGKKHAVNKKGEELWTESFIKNIEKTLSFKSFTTIEDFNQRVESVAKELEEGTQLGINNINSLSIEFEKHDCLLKNTENYDPFKPIFHLVKKDFVPDKNGSYSLFTDGCFKSIGKNAFASCAGWILDNKTQEIVIEFTKTVELNPENIKGKGMPDFELTGISEGIKIIEQLGLKNVQCYTDSIGEAKVIFSALNGLGEKRYNENIEIYKPIIEILEKTNSKIAWIPREYNNHADELTKVPLNAWLDHFNKVYIEQDYIKENGYIVNREKEIYFHHPKIEYKQSEELEFRWTLIAVAHSTDNKGKRKYLVSMLHDRETDSITLLNNKTKDFSYIENNDSFDDEAKRLKKTKPEVLILNELCNEIRNLKDLGDINVCTPAGTIAVCKKLTPIPGVQQEEYFELHKVYGEFPGKLTITNMDKNLQKKIQKFLEKEYPSLIGIQEEKKPKI